MENDNWKNRSLKMICKTCMFFVGKDTNVVQTSDYFIGLCRANAPTMKGWPVIYSSDWCGNHKIDENKLDKLTPNNNFADNYINKNKES